MEENSCSKMGRFCRQWLPKIQVCCHESVSLSEYSSFELKEPEYFRFEVILIPQLLLFFNETSLTCIPLL